MFSPPRQTPEQVEDANSARTRAAALESAANLVNQVAVCLASAKDRIADVESMKEEGVHGNGPSLVSQSFPSAVPNNDTMPGPATGKVLSSLREVQNSLRILRGNRRLENNQHANADGGVDRIPLSRTRLRTAPESLTKRISKMEDGDLRVGLRNRFSCEPGQQLFPELTATDRNSGQALNVENLFRGLPALAFFFCGRHPRAARTLRTCMGVHRQRNAAMP